MSWEFLTEVLKLDKNKLAVTVFGGDERVPNVPEDNESAEIWQSLGVPEHKIARIKGGALEGDDNFWGPLWWLATDVAKAITVPISCCSLCKSLFKLDNGKRIRLVPGGVYDSGEWPVHVRDNHLVAAADCFARLIDLTVGAVGIAVDRKRFDSAVEVD